MSTKIQPHTCAETVSGKAFVTVPQLATTPGVPFSQAAIRMQIARAEQNGLAQHIRRIGRRVLIDLPGYFAWIDGGAA